jgi:hypothetical protein
MSTVTAAFNRGHEAPKSVLLLWLAGAGVVLLACGVVAILRGHASVQEVPIEATPVQIEAARLVDGGRFDHSVVRDLPVDPDDGPGRSVAAYDR